MESEHETAASVLPAPGAAPAPLPRAALRAALDAVHRAGMPGVQAEVRDGADVWRGASGVADLETGRPVTPGLRQRVGSVTKTFTAAAVLARVDRGQVRLDAPIGDYLPALVPGARGRSVTVRMLLNHTSGFSDYLPYAFPSLKGFPSLADVSPESLDANRFRRFGAAELIGMGLAAPPGNAPGGPVGTYSNTNYLLLGELLAEVTGLSAEQAVTRDVIAPAGLADTFFPSGPHVEGPHARMYEALYGLIDPPRDYSVYDNSWVSTGAGLVSTVADLNRFFALLLGGGVVGRASLDEMRRTVPVRSLDGGKTLDYGLGLHRVEVPGSGLFWGHDGTVWGAGTTSLTRADGGRQLSVAFNLMRWNTPDASGKPRPHPIDHALAALQERALRIDGAGPRDL
ncbi:serine hydrolase domain-containing protein [Streptomyces sp. NPDC002564]|uniref:serine hydrolase domain-containing protein n=1 Tax=Streptomyces sp. NPDC002564 TaxID=3364649 RepID=UPI0036A190FC